MGADDGSFPFWLFKMISDNKLQYFERADKLGESKVSKPEQYRWYWDKGTTQHRPTYKLKNVDVIGPVVLSHDERV